MARSAHSGSEAAARQPSELLTLSRVPADVRDRVIQRILAEHAGTLAVLVHGSYAQGQATRFSDLDMWALTLGEPQGEALFRTWFEPAGQRVLHISLGVQAFQEGWLRGSWRVGSCLLTISKEMLE